MQRSLISFFLRAAYWKIFNQYNQDNDHNVFVTGNLARLAYPHPRWPSIFENQTTHCWFQMGCFMKHYFECRIWSSSWKWPQRRMKNSTVAPIDLLLVEALFGDDQSGDEELCQANPSHSHDLRQHCDQVWKLLSCLKMWYISSATNILMCI